MIGAAKKTLKISEIWILNSLYLCYLLSNQMLIYNNTHEKNFVSQNACRKICALRKITFTKS